METVNLSLVDTLSGNAPIPEASVQLFDATGAVFVTSGETDLSGQISGLLLTAATYAVRVFKAGVSFTETTIVVADTAGATPQDFTLNAQSIQVSAPASPSLCRLFADLLEMDGTPLADLVVRVENKFDPTATEGLTVIEPFKSFTTDAAGHVEFDIVRGTRIRVAFVGTGLTRDLTVPDSPTANLISLFGSSPDNFVVVRH